MGVANLSTMTKPSWPVKKRVSATGQLPGVEEDRRVPKDEIGN
jgi:hypothetical protein